MSLNPYIAYKISGTKFNVNALKPHIFEDGVILYGAGENCARFLTSLFLQDIKAKILCIADSDKEKHGQHILGHPVVSAECLMQYDKQAPVLITPSKGYKAITASLKGMGFLNLAYYDQYASNRMKFLARYVEERGSEKFYNFNGVLLPYTNDEELFDMSHFFYETFFFSMFLGDKYDKALIEALDAIISGGHTIGYGYTDGSFDVTIKEGDIVIDAGAWIGDFSAYAANKGAEVYAFEPVSKTFALLEKTTVINKSLKIYPVNKGLSDKTDEVLIYYWDNFSAGNSMIHNKLNESEKISLTTLDIFVSENNINKVDFIKADIEGAEKDMLKGAANVLRTFAPKLAICTYHLPDDPRILEDVILGINPKYKVVHMNERLYAQVPE
jgi:FkbM family methyltransferase